MAGLTSVLRIEIEQLVVLAELVEALLEAIQRVPVAGYQQQHREFGAQRRHAAFFDIAAAGQDDLGQVLNNACSVGTNC